MPTRSSAFASLELPRLGRHIHELLVLNQLKREALHGYELTRRIAEDSGGSVTLTAGTLYPILHDLERQRLIRSDWRSEGARRRRIYMLTHAGASHLRDSVGTLKRAFSDILLQLGAR